MASSEGDEDEVFKERFGFQSQLPNIPDCERIPIPSSTQTQGRLKQWKRECDGYIPPLSGKTLDEGRMEANKIRLGQHFSTFREFDRCMDSYGVIHGRAAAKYATKHGHAVRVCRFGMTNRSSSSSPSYKFKMDDSNSQQPLCPVSEPLLTPVPLQQKWPCSTVVVPLEKHAAMNTHIEQASEYEWCHDSQPQWSQDSQCTPLINPKPSGKENNTLMHIVLGQTKRHPFSNLPNNIPSCRTVMSKPTITVRHTKAWVPPHNPAKSGRRVAVSGACGQLNRFLPPNDPGQQPNEFCPFRVRAQRHTSTGDISITICNLVHNCPQFQHKWRGPNQKSFWLGETLAPRVVRNVKVLVKEMLNGFRMDYKKNSTYHQMWRAVDHVRDWYLGGQRQSYHRIPALLDRIVEVDPHAVVDWSCVGPGKTFQRAFICPSATRQCLHFCQPLVALDACHTKNRKYPTQLFLATCLDGDGRVLILCWAVAPVENKDNWTWFLQNLKNAVELIDAEWIPLISDRQKGLLPAVQDVFPNKIHAHCAHHLKSNVKSIFGKGAAEFFLSAVYASTKNEFNSILATMVQELSAGEEAVNL